MITDLINSAVNKATVDRNVFTFYIQGDLCQMSSQRDFLNRRGIETKQSDVYPVVKEVDKEKVLRLFWEQRPEGWWHYGKEYIALGICTEEQWKNR